MQNKASQNGFTLVEVLVYIVVLTVIVGAMSYFVAQTYKLYAVTLESARADSVGVSINNRLAREIRSGASVTTGESTFGTPNGILTIETTDGVTKRFELSDGRILYTEDGGVPTPLTPEEVTVSAFELSQIITPVSYAVRYTVSITYPGDDGPTVHTYTGAAILRQSYE